MKVIDHILENTNENKDIIIYEYGNPHEILVAKKENSSYALYDLHTKKYIFEQNILEEKILCEYQQGSCVFLQI